MTKEIAEKHPHKLFMKSFSMEDRLKNLSTIIKQFKSTNSGVTVMIQPSNPIYQAYYYPKEESDLEEYALAPGYSYRVHWKAWPNGGSDSL